MKHLFVPYELAVKLKEKGFDEPAICYYNREHNLTSNISPKDWHLNLPYSVSEDCVKAPLYQQVVDWLFEKYLYSVEAELHIPESGKYDGCYVFKGVIKGSMDYKLQVFYTSEEYPTREKAYSAAFDYIFKNLI